MREIKFRAWNGKEMHYIGDLQNIASMGDWRIIDGYKAVMQYTGLKDKNGKEIYEGDVVKWTDYYGEHIRPVEYDPPYIWPFNPRESDPNGDDVEIIGNIYENPELLENKTQ